MKARSTLPFCSLVGLTLLFALPCPARSVSNISTTTSNLPENSNPSSADQGATVTTTTTTTATTRSSNGSWQQSAHDAAENAELAAEKAYNDIKHDVKDVALANKVRAVLHENKFTRNSDVSVRADNGIITLTGAVPSKENAQRAQQVVASVYGVTGVNNRLIYAHAGGAATPRDADSLGIAHPAYSDTAPAEEAPIR